MKEIKRKKMKKQGVKSLAIYALILLILMGVLLAINREMNKEVYKINPRVEKVENTQIGEEDTYETIGWIQIEGTSIDLPIIHNKKDFDYPVELEGYAWMTNKEPKFSNRLIVSAHNIFNLSSQPEMNREEFIRFEELMNFVYYDFAKENKYFQLTLNGKEYVYKVFAVGFVPATTSIFFPTHDKYSKKELKEHLKELEKVNLYQYDIDVNEKDSILSLVTCTRFYGTGKSYEFYVTGRLVRENEKIKDYKVEKSKLYDEIEKKLKGDDENEEV